MSQSPSLGLMVMWFVIVLALIPISLWVLKRSGVAGQMARTDAAAMRTVGQHVLGQGQRLVTVEVGQGDDRRWLVLGVTPGAITPLHSMPLPAEADTGTPDPMPGAGGFAARLAQLTAPKTATPAQGPHAPL